MCLPVGLRLGLSLQWLNGCCDSIQQSHGLDEVKSFLGDKTFFGEPKIYFRDMTPNAFKLWCWRVPWTARISKPWFLKEINPEWSLEGLMLKLQYFGHLMWRADSLEKTLMLGKIEDREEKGMTEDEMGGWHHWLNGHEFEQSPGDGEG